MSMPDESRGPGLFGRPTSLPLQPVEIVSVSIPFWELVMLLVRLALAAIPATLIVFGVGLIGWAAITGTLIHQ